MKKEVVFNSKPQGVKVHYYPVMGGAALLVDGVPITRFRYKDAAIGAATTLVRLLDERDRSKEQS